MTNEAQLIAELKNEATRERAFRILVREYSPRMYSHIARMVHNHDDADDVLQNALIKVWNNIDSFRGESALSTWLYRIAFNEASNFLTHTKTALSIDTPATGNADNDGEAITLASRLMADDYFDGDETEALLVQAVAELPAKQQAVFNMKYYDDMKYEEMSTILDTSIGALKASYHHAVKKITSFFESHE